MRPINSLAPKKFGVIKTLMIEEVTPSKLKSALRKRVEVLAFGISYVGTLKKVDLDEGVIRVEDEKDYVVLEIERIEAFRVLH